MATPPSAAPAPADCSGPGCLLVVMLLPVVVIAGLIIGTVLNRQDDPSDEVVVTLDEGTIDGTVWRVTAERDVEGDTCSFLYQDGHQLTGGCSLTPQDATFGTQTVVFGRASSTADTVRILLDTGEVVEIPTQAADGVDGRFFVQVVDGDVDAESLAPPGL